MQFPVALLLCGAALEWYGILQKEELAKRTGRFNIHLGFGLALLAAGIGALGLSGLTVQAKFELTLKNHISYALYSICVFALALVLHRFWKARAGYWAYSLLLLAGFYCVFLTGYYGGELVHRFGLPNPQPVN